MQEDSLRDKLRAATGIDTSTISDRDVNYIMGLALDEYLRYRPGLELTAAADGITTVKDQPDYDLPDDALWVIGVAWSPNGLDDDDTADGIISDLAFELMTGGWNPQHPSELHVMYQRHSAFRQFFGGHWRVVNGKIWLIPPPRSNGDHVAVYFAKSKTLADLNAVTDQLFVELCAGHMWERKAGDLLGDADWRAGSYARGSAAAMEAVKYAERKLQRARMAASNSFVALRSGSSLSVRSEAP